MTNTPVPRCIHCNSHAFNLTKSRALPYTCSTCKTLYAIEAGRIDSEVLIPLDSDRDNEKYYVRGESTGGRCPCCSYTDPHTARRSCFQCGMLKVRGTSIFQWCWTCLNKRLIGLEMKDIPELSERLKFYQHLHHTWLERARTLYRDHEHCYGGRGSLPIDRIMPDPELPMFDPSRGRVKAEMEASLRPIIPSLSRFISTFI